MTFQSMYLTENPMNVSVMDFIDYLEYDWDSSVKWLGWMMEESGFVSW
jgi:hypothetical protein